MIKSILIHQKIPKRKLTATNWKETCASHITNQGLVS